MDRVDSWEIFLPHIFSTPTQSYLVFCAAEEFKSYGYFKVILFKKSEKNKMKVIKNGAGPAAGAEQ